MKFIDTVAKDVFSFLHSCILGLISQNVMRLWIGIEFSS